MKKADYLILMSTGTPEGQPFTKRELIQQHTGPKAHGDFGWNRPGTDYLILTDGTLETIIPEDSPNVVDLWGISAGVNGMTGTPKYLAYVGGIAEKTGQVQDTRTQGQKETMEAVVQFYLRKFPAIQVLGFDEVPAMKGTKHPGFDIAGWLEAIGIPEENIFRAGINPNPVRP